MAASFGTPYGAEPDDLLTIPGEVGPPGFRFFDPRVVANPDVSIFEVGASFAIPHAFSVLSTLQSSIELAISEPFTELLRSSRVWAFRSCPRWAPPALESLDGLVRPPRRSFEVLRNLHKTAGLVGTFGSEQFFEHEHTISRTHHHRMSRSYHSHLGAHPLTLSLVGGDLMSACPSNYNVPLIEDSTPAPAETQIWRALAQHPPVL